VQSLKNQLEDYQLVSTDIPTGINKYIPTDISTGKNSTDKKSVKYENDHLYEQLQDLVNPQFKAWYCNRFYSLGREQVLRLASQARADGKNPPKLFSYLLRSV
jgi:hypothetical protein